MGAYIFALREAVAEVEWAFQQPSTNALIRAGRLTCTEDK